MDGLVVEEWREGSDEEPATCEMAMASAIGDFVIA
jgi:hypothetical protein